MYCFDGKECVYLPNHIIKNAKGTRVSYIQIKEFYIIIQFIVSNVRIIDKFLLRVIGQHETEKKKKKNLILLRTI